MKPDLSKTEAVKDFPVPTLKTNFRAFLRLCLYYRRFIQNFVSITKPLTISTRTRGNVNSICSEEVQEAFEELLAAVTNIEMSELQATFQFGNRCF